MPHRTYEHPCCPDAIVRRPGRRPCYTCGTPGYPDGWGLSVVEYWCQAERAWQMRAIGPHRGMANELLGPFWKYCDRCKRSGYVGKLRPHTCPDCGGRGGVWDGDEDEIRAAHKAVLDAHPEAARLGSIVLRTHGFDR
ncbi:MAG: hypothetical protein P8188_17295 [Gemmatimonadota bacterium]